MNQNNKQTKIRVNWPNAYFLSLADREEFIETSIMTLKSHYYNTVSSYAYEELLKAGAVPAEDFYKRVEARTNALINEKRFPVKEFIKGEEDRAMVCLNVSNIDSLAIEMALERLSSLEKLDSNSYYEFGIPTTFSIDEFLKDFKKH